MMPMESMGPSVDERNLAALARRGDETAWEQIVHNHQEAVFRLAYLIAGDAADAEDVAQDVFVRAYLKLDQYDSSRPLRPWLLGIAANLARNRRRSIGRYWQAVQRFLTAHRDETAVYPDGDRADAGALWQAVQELPQSSSEIVYLRYFLGMSEAETAETLNIARGTVKSRTHRALSKLRVILENEYPELIDERITR